MNQELTQRLIGAVVVTALAAIFIPMLFDDPVDNSGQVVSELVIPEQPAVVDTPPPVPSSVEDVTPAPENAATAEPGLSSQELSAEPEDNGAATSEEQEFTPPADAETDADMENADEPAQPPDVAEETDVKKAVKQAPAAGVNTVKPVEKPIKKAVAPTVKPALVKKPAAAAVSPAPVKKAIAATTAKPSPKPLKSNPELVRWYIQAGSFSKKENAVSLADNLRKQGLPVLLETLQLSEKGTLYRLKVGPELDKKRAVAMKEKLDQQNIKNILIAE